MKNVTIEIPSQTYYGQRDEEMFFQWLNSINCVEHYEGRGTSLFVTLSSDTVPLRDYLALEGLLKRYNQDLNIMEALTISNPPSSKGSIDDPEQCRNV